MFYAPDCASPASAAPHPSPPLKGRGKGASPKSSPKGTDFATPFPSGKGWG